MAVTQLQVKHNIFERTVGGNTKIEPEQHLSDCLNGFINTHKDFENVVDGTKLASITIKRFQTMKETESGRSYNPSSDTCNRIRRFLRLEISFNLVHDFKARYMPKEKEDF